MPDDNPTIDPILKLLRAFARGDIDLAPKEAEVAANAYLGLLRADLEATQDVMRTAAIIDPSAVRSALQGMPAVSVRFATEETHRGLPRTAYTGVKALLEADPRLASTAVQVAAAYRQRGIAFARSASLAMTRQVQKLMGSLAGARPSEQEAGRLISQMTGWAEDYSRTAFRTATAGADTAARIATHNQPFVGSILLGFEVIGSDDDDTRQGRPRDKFENHKAVLGLRAGTNHPIWERYAPPLGYNCRHFLRSISRMEARRKGWLTADGNHLELWRPPGFENAVITPGFGQLPRR